MKTIQIARTRRIANDAEGNPLNIVVLDLANGKPSIVRNVAQFLQDLKNSYLVDDSVATINHPQVTKALRQLKGGYASGDIAHHKAGEKWTVNENSRVVTDPTHDQYGKVSVGDELEYKNDMTRVEGFLDLELNARHELNREKADALAQAEMAMNGAFDAFSTPSANSTDLPSFDPNDLPKEAVDAAMAVGGEEDPIPKKAGSKTK